MLRHAHHPLPSAISLISARFRRHYCVVSSISQTRISSSRKPPRFFLCKRPSRCANSLCDHTAPPNHQTPLAHQADRGDIGKIFPQAKRLVWTRLVRTPIRCRFGSAQEPLHHPPSRFFLCGDYFSCYLFSRPSSVTANVRSNSNA